MPAPLIILPFIDNLGLTAQALADAMAQTVRPTVLLIDNGSTDRDLSDVVNGWQQECGSRLLHWRYQPPFPSLAGMWNRALQFAWESGQQEALVVNNDVLLAPATFETLRDVQRATEAYVVTGVECKDPAAWAVAQQADVWRAEAHLPMKRLEGPSLSCYLITREGHQAYPFDEGYVPAYGEDIDWHRRIMLGGDGAKAFGLNVPFYHYGSATINRSAEIAATFARRIEQGSRTYHRLKWQGNCNEETLTVPFDPSSAREGVTTPQLFERVRYGQAAL